jgi:hypothetical protein
VIGPTDKLALRCSGVRIHTQESLTSTLGYGGALVWCQWSKRISLLSEFQVIISPDWLVPLLATLGMVANHCGGSMAIKIEQTRDGDYNSLTFQPMERLKVYLFGLTVLFASFGAGEAVYRLLFSEFDGATDRIPVEGLFGLVLAWLATKFVGGVYRNRKERSARLNFILARNHQIRGALEGITPFAHPSRNQQSIRVIREEVDRIDCALKEILPG